MRYIVCWRTQSCEVCTDPQDAMRARDLLEFLTVHRADSIHVRTDFGQEASIDEVSDAAAELAAGLLKSWLPHRDHGNRDVANNASG